MPSVLYLADRGSPAFEAGRTTADVVCAGDSITGWNNFGVVRDWPFRTYPECLQRLCNPLGLTVANGGIAGEVSPNGLSQVQDYLDLFPNARYFVVGYGTNDLGMWPDVERTSPMIIGNLDRMVRAIREGGRRPILLNVPFANESMFPQPVAEGSAPDEGLPQRAVGGVLPGEPDPAYRYRLEAPGRALWRRASPERGGGAGHRQGGLPGAQRGAKVGMT